MNYPKNVDILYFNRLLVSDRVNIDITKLDAFNLLLMF